MNIGRCLLNASSGLALVAIGLLGGWWAFAFNPFDHSEKVIGQLERENEALREESGHLRYINDLAVEFSTNPLIVTVIDQYSREYLRNEGPEWRLLRTPEFVTYIMLSLIYAESKGDPTAVGDEGKARGLTQIWVTTAQQYGKVSPEELLDAETNILYAFKHFHYLLKKYRGNAALALYAWNQGSGTVDKFLAYGQAPQSGYGKRVYQAALTNNRELPFVKRK